MRYLFLGLIFLSCNRVPSPVGKEAYNETHRPQIHFSPKCFTELTLLYPIFKIR